MENLDIQSPEIKYILHTMKLLHQRLQDVDMVGLSSLERFDTLAKEFEFFIENYPKLFSTLVNNQDLSTCMQALYCKDKILRGEMTEEHLSRTLQHTFLTPEVRDLLTNPK